MSTMLSPKEVVGRYPSHDYSLSGLLQSRAQVIPDKSFLVYADQSWTYRQFEAAVLRMATWLHAKGVTHGDRLAVYSRNHPTTILLLFALARLGAIMVPINPDYGQREAAYVLRNAGVCGVICSSLNYDTAQQAVAQMNEQPWIVVNTDIQLPTQPDPIPITGKSQDTCLFIYTSGTTGAPKGVMHGQQGYVITAEAFIVRLALQPSDRILCVLPLFHINALFYSVGGALASGATLLLAERFSASRFWDDVVRLGATTTNLIGAAATILAKRDRQEFRPEHHLRKVFVAPLNVYLQQIFNAEFGIQDLIECYGMTEIPGVLSNPFYGLRKLGSMGTISPHLATHLPQPILKVVDEDFVEVGINQPGILLVRTPTMMQGYYRDMQGTQAAFHADWFITGDIVWRDKDDFYWFVARQKDIIRCRGENISGAELDRVICEHPQVLEAATIGVPSELGEEDIFAIVVPRPNAQLSPQDIATWVGQQLTSVKIPRYVTFVASLPRTPTQRVEKFKLKADTELFERATTIG